MPNLQKELADLVLADKHITIAEHGVQQMAHNLEGQRRGGGELEVFERSLFLAKTTLLEFRAHRDLIVATIADIRAGRLPST